VEQFVLSRPNPNSQSAILHFSNPYSLTHIDMAPIARSDSIRPLFRTGFLSLEMYLLKNTLDISRFRTLLNFCSCSPSQDLVLLSLFERELFYHVLVAVLIIPRMSSVPLRKVNTRLRISIRSRIFGNEVKFLWEPRAYMRGSEDEE
jgi:hypothetical protein